MLSKKEISKTKRRKLNKSQMELWALTIPAIIFVFIFSYLPMGGLVVAFKNYNYTDGIFGSPWNGLDNFAYLFKSNSFFVIVRNTLLYNFAFILLGTIIAVFCALMLYAIYNKYAIKIFQSSMFVPYVISWVVVSYISHGFLSYDYGLVNNLLEFFGKEKISFYTQKVYWPYILIFFNMWKCVGYNTLMYYGSMLGIDQELYEAATIDGCSYFKKIIYITIPGIKPILIMMFILGLGGIFRSDFGLFYYIPKDSGSLYSVTDVIDTYVMRTIQVTGSIGESSAVGFVQSIVGFITVVAANSAIKKISEENALI